MYESVLQNALRLPRQLKEELVAALKAAIFEEMAARPAGDPSRCPRCGHAHVVSKGRDRDGGRRWLCRGCGRTFVASTSTVMSSMKLPREKFRAMANLMLNDVKLEAIIDSVGISSRTAYVWRMKIYAAVFEIQ